MTDDIRKVEPRLPSLTVFTVHGSTGSPRTVGSVSAHPELSKGVRVPRPNLS